MAPKLKISIFSKSQYLGSGKTLHSSSKTSLPHYSLPTYSTEKDATIEDATKFRPPVQRLRLKLGLRLRQEKDNVFTQIRKVNTVAGSPKKWTRKRRFYADSESQHIRFWRSSLFFVNSSEVNNTQNDDYCLNNLASPQRLEFPPFETRPKSSRFQPICYHQRKCSSACSSSTLLRLTAPKATTAWTTSPLFREFNFLSINRDQKSSHFQPIHYNQTKCFFRRSGLFFVDSSEANNPKSDYYLNNLTSLQGVQLPLYQSRPKSSDFQPICYNRTKCSFQRSELFIIDPYKANNLFSDDYMNTLATALLQREDSQPCIYIYIVRKVNVAIDSFKVAGFESKKWLRSSEIKEDCFRFALRQNEDLYLNIYCLESQRGDQPLQSRWFWEQRTAR